MPVRPPHIVATIADEELVGLRERAGIEKRRLRDTELEIEEANVSKVPTKMHTPSPDEYNRHCATHIPYAIGARSVSNPRNGTRRTQAGGTRTSTGTCR